MDSAVLATTRKIIMSKTYLFHGGPLQSEYFGGHTFWATTSYRAEDYMDGEDDLWVVEVDKSCEVIADEENYLSVNAYQDADSADGNYAVQTAAINAAVADGATIVLCDDGWVIVNVARLNPRKISKTDAEDLW